MRTFGLTIPITGYIYKEVEAETENEAIEIAFEQGYTLSNIQETDMHEKVCRGNVFYGLMNEMEVDDLGEVD